MIRYSPMAEVRILSLTALVEKLTDGDGARVDNFAQAFSTLQSALSQHYGNLYHYLRELVNEIGTDGLFSTIGTATNVRISEDYGTRSVYGIGEPTNPVLVPNNLAVRVSISKLTIDKAAVSRYAMKPVYWYEPRLQRAAIDTMIAANSDLLGADYFFYSYLVLKDMETGGLSTDYVEALDNDYILAFMPRDYSVALSNNTTLIETNVNGEGKALRILDILQAVVDKLEG